MAPRREGAEEGQEDSPGGRAGARGSQVQDDHQGHRHEGLWNGESAFPGALMTTLSDPPIEMTSSVDSPVDGSTKPVEKLIHFVVFGTKTPAFAKIKVVM